MSEIQASNTLVRPGDTPFINAFDMIVSELHSIRQRQDVVIEHMRCQERRCIGYLNPEILGLDPELRLKVYNDPTNELRLEPCVRFFVHIPINNIDFDVVKYLEMLSNGCFDSVLSGLDIADLARRQKEAYDTAPIEYVWENIDLECRGVAGLEHFDGSLSNYILLGLLSQALEEALKGASRMHGIMGGKCEDTCGIWLSRYDGADVHVDEVAALAARVAQAAAAKGSGCMMITAFQLHVYPCADKGLWGLFQSWHLGKHEDAGRVLRQNLFLRMDHGGILQHPLAMCMQSHDSRFSRFVRRQLEVAGQEAAAAEAEVAGAAGQL